MGLLQTVVANMAGGKDSNRPQLQAALDYVRDGDTFIIHSMDRLTRNVDDLRRIVRQLMHDGVSCRPSR